MKHTIDALRKLYTKEQSNERGPNNYFNFWDMPEGGQCIVRFLPDLNDENPFGFVVEKKTHTLNINGKPKSIPCNSMHGKDCPICAVAAGYYKANDKVNGKKYYRKASYVAQVLVVESSVPLKDGEESPVGKVKLMSLGYSIWNIITDAIKSGDLDEVPFAFENGCDFIIKKEKQGEYASYVLSRFARKSTDLSPDVIAYVQSEMKDLATTLPSAMDVDVVEAMLEAEMSGTPYNDSSSSSQSAERSTSTSSASTLNQATSPQQPAKVVADAASVSASSTDDVDADAAAKAAEVIANIKRRMSRPA